MRKADVADFGTADIIKGSLSATVGVTLGICARRAGAGAGAGAQIWSADVVVGTICTAIVAAVVAAAGVHAWAWKITRGLRRRQERKRSGATRGLPRGGRCS